MLSPTKEITIYDIAKALNLSPATISRGLKNNPLINKKTRKIIVAKAQELGYQPNRFASSLRSRRTYTIGVVVPFIDYGNTSSIIAAIEQAANAAGYMVIICQSMASHEKEKAQVKALFDSRVDGLLISMACDDCITAHDAMIRKRIPTIFLDSVQKNARCASVMIDNFKAAYEMTTHLIMQGCRRLAYITCNAAHPVFFERLKGYQHALLEHGLEYDESLIVVGDLSLQTGESLSKKLLKMSPRPDAVFAANDTAVISCMQHLKNEGVKIPDDIAFAGFIDHAGASTVEPNLTAIYYSPEEMGRLAVNALVKSMDKTESGRVQKIILQHQLMVRKSSVRFRGSV